MEATEADFRIPELPDEMEYPRELREGYELLECFSDKESTRTLLALDRKSGETCVVKCYLREHPLYGRREPESLRKLAVPPMPRFLGEYGNEEMRCVLREYVPGETLSRLAGERAFTQAEVTDIGVQLCDQLRSLHTLVPPVIHRDIKPQNVIVRPDGTAVLIDFGIARVQTEKDTDTVAFGTQGFAPPEQYGYARTDERSDIYSLGVLLYWLQHRETRVPPKGHSALDKILARCTCFDPAKRYPTAEHLKRALLAARPEEQRKKRLTLALGAALLLILAVLGIRQGLRPQPKAVVFSQPLIRQAVQANLGIEDGVPITEDLLERVTAVYIVADAAYPDSDSFYSAIQSWYAEGKTRRGPITDLGDLALLPRLEQVGIVAQELRDISALADHPQLNKLELKHNYITDISVLAGMDHLTSVGINGNPVGDISPLAACPNLAFLDLCDVRSYEPSVIARLGNFDFLDISNPTESYRWLDGKSILDLRIAWSGLDDLHCLDRVTRLEALEIDHTDVSDLSPLALHKGLKVLKLSGLPVTDLRVLRELPQLEELWISRDRQSAVEALGELSFTVHYE